MSVATSWASRIPCPWNLKKAAVDVSEYEEYLDQACLLNLFQSTTGLEELEYYGKRRLVASDDLCLLAGRYCDTLKKFRNGACRHGALTIPGCRKLQIFSFWEFPLFPGPAILSLPSALTCMGIRIQKPCDHIPELSYMPLASNISELTLQLSSNSMHLLQTPLPLKQLATCFPNLESLHVSFVVPRLDPMEPWVPADVDAVCIGLFPRLQRLSLTRVQTSGAFLVLGTFPSLATVSFFSCSTLIHAWLCQAAELKNIRISVDGTPV